MVRTQRVIKLNSSGGIVWQKTYGGTGDDDAEWIQQTSDNGYFVTGQTSSFGSGNGDAWVLKLDSNGNVVWQKTYGGSGTDFLLSAQQTTDGGYVLAGRTTSFGAGALDGWVIKLDSSGNVAWQRTYGGSNVDRLAIVRQTADGGFVVSGRTSSFGTARDDPHADLWMLKLNSDGTTCIQSGSVTAPGQDTHVTGSSSSASAYGPDEERIPLRASPHRVPLRQ